MRIFLLGIAGAAIAIAIAVAQTATTQRTNQTQPFASRTLPQRQLNLSPATRSMFQSARARPLAQAFRTSLARMPRTNLAAIDRSRVPVLLAPRQDLMPNWHIFASPDRYTASTRNSGTVYEINGTRLPTVAPAGMRPQGAPAGNQPANPPASPMRLRAFADPGTPPPPPGQDALENVHIDHTASGIDVTFTRFGHVYNVSIDCGGPAEAENETAAAAPGQRAKARLRTANPDCTDASALAFAQKMEVVGGGAP